MNGRKKLVFATNNADKLREIRAIASDYDIVSLKEIGCFEELPETADTIAGNAMMKAKYVSEKYGIDCFADDTGLEVNSLGGAPGVRTARYASSEGHDSESNIKLLIDNLKDKSDRSARFVTFIALIKDGKEYLFEGECKGKIRKEKSGGKEGFGYDPVFEPDGYEITFAQMSQNEKNMISHRGKATRKLIEYLKYKK